MKFIRPRLHAQQPAILVTAMAIALAAFMIAAIATACGGDSSNSDASGSPSGNAAGKQLPVGPVRVANVEVLEPVSDAGRVPLNTPVERTWMLRNTGTEPVKLGRPGIEVLEGC